MFTKNLLDKRKIINPKFQVNDLVRRTDLKKTFSKRDTINWSNNLYEITEIINDTIPSYKIDNSKERHKEAFLKKTKLSRKEFDNVLNNINLS